MKIFFQKIFWNICNRSYQLQKELHTLKSISIEITGSCNLHCRHCYMESSGQATSDLTAKEWKIFFKDLCKNFGNKLILSITGGEPLFRSDIFEILDFAKNLGFRINLTTNGVLLNHESIIKLTNLIMGLSISLDGQKDCHNLLRGSAVYDKTLANIILCQKAKFRYLMIKTAINKKNLHALDELFEIIKESGVDEWHVFAIEPLGRARQEDMILSNEEYAYLCESVDRLKRTNKNKIKIRFGEESNNFLYEKICDFNKFKLCSQGINRCAILHNGDIVSCLQGARNDIQGDITKDDFRHVWNNKFLKNRVKNYKSCGRHYF